MKGMLLAIILCISSPLFSHAQLRVAILAGIHIADVKEENDLPNYDVENKGYKSRTGGRFGFMADLPLSNSRFFFQPGIIFSSKGRKFADSIYTPTGGFYQTPQQFIN